MKAYKLNLKDYKVKRNKVIKNQIESVDENYGIKDVIANIICHPDQKHNGFRFLTVSKVAEKIADYPKDSIVLDNSEYTILKESFDSFKGFSRNDAELVRRVYEAEEVEVEEKKKKGKK